MKLTTYIMDLGRPVAFYPELKKLTGSTTATIFLCQLLYWTPRTKNQGKWIYKTNYEIEEETGLTYNEQKTAKKLLSELGIIDYEVKRWDRTTAYRVEEEQLNSLWEAIKSGSTKEIETPVVDEEYGNDITQNSEGSPEEYFNKKWEEGKEKRTEFEAEIKKGITKKAGKELDLVDGTIDATKSYGMKKASRIEEITLKIEKKLHINISNDKRWDDFVEFAYINENKGQPIGVFLDWLTGQADFELKYWSPQRMMTFYPQAFIETEKAKPIEAWADTPIKKTDDVFAPLPQSLSRRRE